MGSQVLLRMGWRESTSSFKWISQLIAMDSIFVNCSLITTSAVVTWRAWNSSIFLPNNFSKTVKWPKILFNGGIFCKVGLLNNMQILVEIRLKSISRFFNWISSDWTRVSSWDGIRRRIISTGRHFASSMHLAASLKHSATCRSVVAVCPSWRLLIIEQKTFPSWAGGSIAVQFDLAALIKNAWHVL